ncbi:MAG: hypothetical protein WC714_18675 [Candidatus Obscuribacterales bacterium]
MSRQFGKQKDKHKMLNIILVCLLGAAVAGIPGYFISRRFNSSNYAATNKSGDFGSPRGGIFALGSGMLIGLMFFAYVGQHLFAQEAIGPGMITSLIAGTLGGVLGLFHGQRSRKPKE